MKLRVRYTQPGNIRLRQMLRISQLNFRAHLPRANDHQSERVAIQSSRPSSLPHAFVEMRMLPVQKPLERLCTEQLNTGNKGPPQLIPLCQTVPNCTGGSNLLGAVSPCRDRQSRKHKQAVNSKL